MPKLVPNLLSKANYVVHYRNLKLYYQLGMDISKVHRILKFEQLPWLKTYIMKNTDLRRHAMTEFKRDFFKLMNNGVFGKTMENVRQRINIRLLRAEEEKKSLLRAIAKPSFTRSILFDNDLVGVCR